MVWCGYLLPLLSSLEKKIVALCLLHYWSPCQYPFTFIRSADTFFQLPLQLFSIFSPWSNLLLAFFLRPSTTQNLFLRPHQHPKHCQNSMSFSGSNYSFCCFPFPSLLFDFLSFAPALSPVKVEPAPAPNLLHCPLKFKFLTAPDPSVIALRRSFSTPNFAPKGALASLTNSSTWKFVALH